MLESTERLTHVGFSLVDNNTNTESPASAFNTHKSQFLQPSLLLIYSTDDPFLVADKKASLKMEKAFISKGVMLSINTD